MAIPTTEQVYLNAAIADFNASLGWNGDRGTLSTTLVDDPQNNLIFTGLIPGSPTFFNFGGWIYGGIYRDFVKISEVPGGITYRVNLTDASEILQNVQLNLDGYAGISPVNNFFNIYGYLETTLGYGASQVNEAGMEYNILLPTLSLLANNTGGDSTIAQYGGFITFVGYQYILDLSLMPQSIPNYRISGPTVNLLDFIAEVCEDNSLDWFARLLFTGGRNVIQIVTVSRSRSFNVGAITQFINSVPGAHSKGIGLELRNEPTAKVVVGDNVLNLNTFDSTFPSGFLNTKAGITSVTYAGANLGGLNNFTIRINLWDNNYPKDFAFNFKFNPFDQRQVRNGAYPVCFPHLDNIYDITQNDIWPFWGTDVYGQQYIPTHAQETVSFISLMSSCFSDFDSIRNINKDPIMVGGKKHALMGLVTKDKKRDVCGKSVLSTLTWYHDNIFFSSPIPTYPYNISLGELRAALISQDAWENYISNRSSMCRNADKWVIGYPDYNHKEIYTDYGIPIPVPEIKDKNGKVVVPGKFSMHDSVGPPGDSLYGRDDLLGITPIYALSDLAKLLPVIAGGGPVDQKDIDASLAIVAQGAYDKYNPTRLRLEKQYEAVHKLATEYYGRKFIVSVRNVFVKLNDQLQPVYTDDPEKEGFFTGSSILGLNYLEQQFFTNPEGKIEAFVEFDSVNFIDITRLQIDDFIIKDRVTGNTYTNRNDIYDAFSNAKFSKDARLYLKCSIEPNLVFKTYVLSLQALGAAQNSLDYSEARIIVSLPYPVYFRNDAYIFNCRGTIQEQQQDLVFGMTLIYPNDGAILNTLAANGLGQVLNDNSRDSLNKALNGVGAKGYNQEIAGYVMIPRNGAYGLKSNTTFYGPWYAQGAPGKVEFEQDTTLNPWNFNGYANMNLAGQAKVTSIASTMQFAETGSVEFPDVPSVLLGDVLIAGGPNVTDVAVTVGPQGILTNYSMRSFSPAYGGLSKLMYQKIRDSSRKTVLDQRNEKVVERVFGGRLLQAPQGDIKKLDVRMGTPHPMLVGGVITQAGQISGTSIVTESFLEARADLGGGNYKDIGGMSLEGMFRPYCTSISGDTNLPKFIQPISYSTIISSGSLSGTIVPSNLVSALNPFPSGHNITYVVRGDTLPTNLNVLTDSGTTAYPSNNRGVALKLPAIGYGFGLDTNGNYVPGNVSGYNPDYASNQSGWMVGPIDLRWDSINGVWTAASTGRTTLYYGIIQSSLGVGQSGIVFGITSTTDNINQPSGTVINQLNYPVCSGTRALLFKDYQNFYNIINTQFNPLNIVTNVTCQTDGTLIIGKRTIYLPAAFSLETNTVIS